MNIKLEKREIQIILRGLAELPYKESAALIRKIVDMEADDELKKEVIA